MSGGWVRVKSGEATGGEIPGANEDRTLKSVELSRETAGMRQFASSKLRHGELQLRPGPWVACKSLQSYGVFLGRFN